MSSAMLRLTAELHEAIKQHGISAYPYEGCGLLLGQIEEGVNIVTAVRPLPNVWPDEAEKRIRFRIAEDDWRDVEIEAMLEDMDVVGVFHSHPDHPPIASGRDLAWAAWPGYSYLITRIDGGLPVSSRSWQLLPDRSGFIEEAVEEIS
jgi:proteasome lid subunit RPN8/RPN11